MGKSLKIELDETELIFSEIEGDEGWYRLDAPSLDEYFLEVRSLIDRFFDVAAGGFCPLDKSHVSVRKSLFGQLLASFAETEEGLPLFDSRQIDALRDFLDQLALAEEEKLAKEDEAEALPGWLAEMCLRGNDSVLEPDVASFPELVDDAFPQDALKHGCFEMKYRDGFIEVPEGYRSYFANCESVVLVPNAKHVELWPKRIWDEFCGSIDLDGFFAD